jgi:hypothetical protein
MTTVGRWNPNKVRERVLNGTWVSPEELGGMVLLTPTSIAYTGTSATISANGSVTFSACTSLSLNGVFSADYDNYMISVHATTSAESYINFRFRASGTDNATASSYTEQRLYAESTSVGGSRGSTDLATIHYLTSGLQSGATGFIYGPYLAQPTAMRFTDVANIPGNAGLRDFAHTHNQSSSYDGFTFLAYLSRSFTGLVSVYGLVGA